MNRFEIPAQRAITGPSRCSCVLCLDTSTSMEGAPIAELNAGINRLFEEIWATTKLRMGLDLGIVAFSSGARVLRPLPPLTLPAPGDWATKRRTACAS